VAKNSSALAQPAVCAVGASAACAAGVKTKLEASAARTHQQTDRIPILPWKKPLQQRHHPNLIFTAGPP